MVLVDPRDLCRCSRLSKVGKACGDQDRAEVGSREERFEVVSWNVFDLCRIVSIDVVKDDEARFTFIRYRT